jgi:hypothetical protein
MKDFELRITVEDLQLSNWLKIDEVHVADFLYVYEHEQLLEELTDYST